MTETPATLTPPPARPARPRRVLLDPAGRVICTLPGPLGQRLGVLLVGGEPRAVAYDGPHAWRLRRPVPAGAPVQLLDGPALGTAPPAEERETYTPPPGRAWRARRAEGGPRV